MITLRQHDVYMIVSSRLQAEVSVCEYLSSQYVKVSHMHCQILINCMLVYGGDDFS